MAWRSSGSTNEEMVDNLKKFGVISNEVIERGFRSVDRKLFVPKGNSGAAYADQPLKEGHVHISAPHIYGSALEALELQEDSCMSFLNIGSGTGYLSCIVAKILGPRSVNYGIEIHEDVVQHSQKAIEAWSTAMPDANAVFSHLQVVHGNALCVLSGHGETLVGFDRIYIGASVDKASLPRITKLLSPGGILVGPVEDELLKIVRIGPLPDQPQSDTANQFTQQVLSGVRFAPLLTLPSIRTMLPSRLWTPQVHRFFPTSFQQATMNLLMCSNAHFFQPRKQHQHISVNLAAMLPRVIWIEILSYTHRKWFESKESETQFLRNRLREEQANAAKAQQARIEAETRCHVAERERDVYRLLARRWQSRLQLILQQQRQLIESGVIPPSNASLTALTSLHNANNSQNPNPDEAAAIIGLNAMLQHSESQDTHHQRSEYFSNQDSNMQEDQEDTEHETIIHEHQPLAQLFHDSDDDHYDFQSIPSETEEQSSPVAHARTSTSHDEDDSVQMEESDAFDETDHHHMRCISNKPNSKINVRDLRPVSMGSDDL